MKGKRVSSDGAIFRCDDCGFEPMMASDTDDLLQMQFCPHCGIEFEDQKKKPKNIETIFAKYMPLLVAFYKKESNASVENSMKLDLLNWCDEAIKDYISGEKNREIILQAHMAGQRSAGVDPSFSSAQRYLDTLMEEKE